METTTLSVSQAREELPELLNRAAYGDERLIVSRRGKPLAAIIPIRDLRLLELLEQEELDRIDIAEAEKAMKEMEGSGGSPLEEVMRRLGD
jgi:prevent-host-death family protein